MSMNTIRYLFLSCSSKIFLLFYFQNEDIDNECVLPDSKDGKANRTCEKSAIFSKHVVLRRDVSRKRAEFTHCPSMPTFLSHVRKLLERFQIAQALPA